MVGRFTTTPVTDDITNSNFHKKHVTFQLSWYFFIPSELVFHLFCTGETPMFLYLPVFNFVQQTIKGLSVPPQKRSLVFLTITVAAL